MSPSAVGEVLVEPDEGPPIRLALTRGRDTEGGSVFVANVPPGDVPSATTPGWRTPACGRPARCAVLAPAGGAVDRRLGGAPGREAQGQEQASGEPYTELQRGGDVVYRLEGSRVRLELTAQVPVAEYMRIEGKARASRPCRCRSPPIR